MTLDKSYYSSIRYPSKMRIRLVKHSIPTNTPRVEEGFVTAQFTGFESYNYRTNTENTINETVDRPIGNFSHYADTPVADNEGNFAVTPTIVADFGYAQRVKKVCIFFNSNRGNKIKSLEYFDYNNMITGTVEPSGDLVEIEAPDGQELDTTLTIRILSAEPNSKVSVGAIVFGDVLEVDTQDVIQADTNESGDVTGARLTSKQLNFSLYNTNNKYNDDFNTVVINHIYGQYYSENIAYFVSEITPDNATNTPTIKFKADDLFSKMTDLYTQQEIKNGTKDRDEAQNIVAEALKRVGFDISLSLFYNEIGYSTIYLSPIFHKEFAVILHYLSFVSGYIYNPHSDAIEIVNFDWFKKDAEKTINLKECFGKPSKKIYPLIKNCTFSFTNATLGEKENIFESIMVNFTYSPSLFTGKIKLPDNYYIPENAEGYIYYVAEYEGGLTQLKDIVADIDGFSYNIIDGVLYIYESAEDLPAQLPSYKFSINAKKTLYNVTSQSHLINTSGEDLELKSDVLSILPHILAQKGEEWQRFCERRTEAYNYNQEYTFDLRGRFDIGLYDTIYAEIEKNTLCKCIVTEHKLVYNGAHKSNIKVISLNEFARLITPRNDLFPSNDITPNMYI